MNDDEVKWLNEVDHDVAMKYKESQDETSHVFKQFFSCKEFQQCL